MPSAERKLLARPRLFAGALLLALAVLLADQASKAVALERLGAGQGPIALADFFSLVLVWNTGVSFGRLQSLPPWLLSGFALAVCAGLVLWLRHIERPLAAIAVGLVTGGAIGNLVDRLRFGAVADFLDFHIGAWHWPAFNLADAAISLGVASLLGDALFGGRRRDRT